MKFIFSCFLSFGFIVSIGQTLSTQHEVDQYFQKAVSQNKIAGAVMLVEHKGKIAMHTAYGYQDKEEKIKMDTSSIFRIYSMTKPITSLAAMILVEEGKISLDEPINKYLPELSDLKVLKGAKKVAPKRKVIVKDLLRHTSGFAYGLGLGASRVDLSYNTNHPLFVTKSDQMIERLAGFSLQSEPGEEYHYSLSVDVLGAIIERVSGKSLGEFMNEKIFQPIGMKDTHFQLPASKIKRFCSIYGVGLRLKESYKSSEFSKDRMHQGGGGLVSTTSDYLKFCRLMLNKGIYNSDTIISPALVDQMTQNQLPEGQGVYKRGGKVAIGFGLGFSVNLQEWGKYGREGDYGWSGIGGTHFKVSPKNESIIIIMTQKQPLNNKVQRELIPIVYEGFGN